MTKRARKRIEVRICCGDVPVNSPSAFFDAVQEKLAAAGVEFSDGEPVGGSLRRTDDPCDFGVSVWTFIPWEDV